MKKRGFLIGAALLTAQAPPFAQGDRAKWKKIIIECKIAAE